MAPTVSAGVSLDASTAVPSLIEGLIGDSDVIVWLASADADARARRRQSATEGVTAALAEADDARHLVLVSSAMVYGAWANNPVPITEEAVLRPDVEFVYARQLGSVEQLADEWRLAAAGPHGHRPAARASAMAADSTVGLAAALAAGMGQRVGEDDPPAQFLHLDDLASAVVLAAEQRLDGVYNVAPDGWVPGERVRALAGAVPRLKLPDRVTEVIGNLRWRFQRGPIPPGLRSYTRWPWLVANDRLKAEGWAPTVTNEQAYVEGTEAQVVDDGQPEAPPGDRPRRPGDAARRGRHQSHGERYAEPNAAAPPADRPRAPGQTHIDGAVPNVTATSADV